MKVGARLISPRGQVCRVTAVARKSVTVTDARFGGATQTVPVSAKTGLPFGYWTRL